MAITRNCLKVLLWSLLWVCAWDLCRAFADELYAPDYLWERGIAQKTDPVDIADTHLKIPYREDGVIDHRGYFTTFNRQDEVFAEPGLNCSGLVVSVCRFLFNRNWDLPSLTRDPQGNSGPGSALGQDWDFGWDLILNLTAGSPRRLVTPDGSTYPVEKVDPLNTRGFDLHDAAAWRGVLGQMKPGHVYLGSISKASRKPGYKVLHYHVMLMVPDTKGNVWLYHSTVRSSAHKMNIRSPQGMERFMSQFRSDRGVPKNILIVEAKLPDLQLVAQAPADAGSTPAPPVGSAPAERPAPREPQPPAAEVAGPGRTGGPAPESTAVAALETGRDSGATAPPAAPPQLPKNPDLVVEHRSGKVFKAYPDLVTHIPVFADKELTGVRFWFRNLGRDARNIELLIKTPDGDTLSNKLRLAQGNDLAVVYPGDFGIAPVAQVKKGKYVAEVRVDGERWCADAFEVTRPKEAEPRVIQVQAPSVVEAGKTFAVKVVARNKGAESDYGGITVSSPDPSGLRLVAANPGKLYPPGSTVLSVTTDKIRTKFPMAERWINLWGENQSYDMEVRIQAGRPGTYPLYVRCALRGVNIKSSVVLMDPAGGDTADQQGFPVQVHSITVR